MYIAAATIVLWPLCALLMFWDLGADWRRPEISASIAVIAAFVLYMFFVGRWDSTSCRLRYVFLLALVTVTWLIGGWMPSGLIVLGTIALWCYLHRPPRERALECSFPLRAGTFCVVHGGDYQLLNHHRKSRSQRYALDIVKLNFLGGRAAGIYPAHLEAYRIFNEVVYAPCAGSVTASVDDQPDLPPGQMDRNNIAGNHIVIRCAGIDVYIGIAHLRQGSVLVRTGEEVAAGQPLARVGNSGHTSEPHLHIHAKRGGAADSMLDGEGVPIRFNGRWLIRSSIVRHSEDRLRNSRTPR
jgi:hypothetical protein